PRQAVDVPDERVIVAADVHRTQATRPLVEVDAFDADGFGGVGAIVEGLRFVAVTAQSDTGFSDEGRIEHVNEVDAGTLRAIDSGGCKALAAATGDAEAAGVEHFGAL